MTQTEKMARRMMKEKHLRDEAEKMMGCKWEEMTKQKRALAAACLAAFNF